MVGVGGGAGPECCQLCWLRDDEESGVRTWWWSHPGTDNTKTSDTMLTFPLVLVSGEAYSQKSFPIFPIWQPTGSCVHVLFVLLLKLLQYCDAFRWRKASLSISSHLFIRSSSGILYFKCMFFLCILPVKRAVHQWMPSELNFSGMVWVGVAGFSNFNLMEHLKDNWQLDPNIPPTYFILPAHQQSSGESNKVDIGCWMQNSSPLTRVWPMEF